MMFLSACGGDNDNGQAPQPTATKPAPTATQPAPTATQPAPTATQPAPTATQPAPTATQPGATATQGEATPTPTTPTVAECGNDVVEGTEECDDGNTIGGDGCAANCTNETRRLCTFGTGTGATVQTKLFAIPLSFTGNQTLTTGGVRSDDPAQIVPVIIKPEDVNYDPVSVPGLVCACVRGIASEELGGGNSARGQVGCSDSGLTDTDYLYSLNHNIGVVGANGFTEQDCTDAGGTVEDGSTEHPHAGVCNGPSVITFSGQGGKGSSVIESNTAISLISDGGACVTDGSGDPALYGDDGIACTDDDPGQAEASTLATTSGTASAELLNASNVKNSNIDGSSQCGALPCVASITGAPIDCDAAFADPTGGLSGAANGSAFGTFDAASIGDNVTTSSSVCQ